MLLQLVARTLQNNFFFKNKNSKSSPAPHDLIVSNQNTDQNDLPCTLLWKSSKILCGIVAAQFALPILMPYLIRWFIYAEYFPLWWVFVYIVAIFVSQVTNVLFQYHTMLTCYSFGIRVRASLTTLVYRKSLYTSLSRTQTSGMVVNLISTDAQILLETLHFFIQGMYAPLMIIVVLGLLSMYLDAFCLISLAVALLATPITAILAGRLGIQMALIQKKGDTRLKLVKELLTAIRIVKYYAWELPFLRNIDQARLDQLVEVKRFLFARSWLLAVLINIPGVGIGLTFFFYGLKYNMKFESVFSAMVYLNMLAIPFIYLPMLLAFGAQYFASIKRIEFFGLRSELEPRKVDTYDEEEDGNDENKKTEKSKKSKIEKIKPKKEDEDSSSQQYHSINDSEQDESDTSSEESSEEGEKGKKKILKKENRAGMYIRGSSFSWETLLSIAEGRFIDLENKEAMSNAMMAMTADAKEKKRLKGEVTQAQAEKVHITNIIKSIQKQTASGVSVHDVNIDKEEEDCIDAAEEATDSKTSKTATNKDEKEDGDDNDSENEQENEEETEKERQNKKKSKKQPPSKKTSKKKSKTTEQEETEVEEIGVDGEVAAASGGKQEKAKKKKKQFVKLRRPVVNLHDINFEVREGALTMVVGSVGSGKSTLAMAFLGETHQLGGRVRVFSEYAYASQEAWILNATIRDNITFGSEFDEERYEEVIGCCALATDLKSFPASDLTEIGERGINLSGGQKQRINVARAMYSRAPIVILDDPFSAVDSHVGEHMFEHVAQKMRDDGRAVLLITNQLHFVPFADHIGVLKKGRIVEQGSFEELNSNEQGTLAKMLAKQKRRQQKKEAKNEAAGTENTNFVTENPALKQSANLVAPVDINKSSEIVSSSTINEIEGDEGDGNDGSAGDKSKFHLTPTHDDENRRKGALILIEERETGNIGVGTYWEYLKSGSVIVFLFYLLFRLCTVALNVFSGIWLSWWSDPTNKRGYSKGEYLGAYMGLILGQVVTSVSAGLIFVYFCVNTGKNLHSRMINSVSKTPIGWFDRTPIGRIIARFSKDFSLIDMEMPSLFDSAINFVCMLLGLLASIATGTPYILIIIGVALFAFGALLLHYRKTSIQVQRIESLSRAPIFSHFTETLEGVITIRAYRMENAFKVANMNKIDVNNVDFLGLRYCASWFAMTLDLMGAITVALSFIAMVLVRHLTPSAVNIGFIIFAISQTGGVTQTLAAVSHLVTDLENKMNSVERILQYSRLPSEGPFEIPDKKPDASWPHNGRIVLENLSVEYKKDLPVLKNLNCVIKPREKVGIVGRTGAGKSTLITALFRTMEPKNGKIIIDDVDITSIGLTDLRSKLSIIPQTPTLFVGTVRYNLDPFEEHGDDDLWRVLKMVKLKKHIAQLDGKLLAPVEENGSNFSVGQRQLLAMSRCLLRETHVLLLDEATAAVDVETDALLQRMIRKNFRDKTVLTIAHRLNTIMDSDRIMVLDAGEIAEFDTPKRLLQNKKGILYGMVKATGAETSEYLHEIANMKAAADEELAAQEELVVESKKKKKSKKAKAAAEDPESEEKKEDQEDEKQEELKDEEEELQDTDEVPKKKKKKAKKFEPSLAD